MVRTRLALLLAAALPALALAQAPAPAGVTVEIRTAEPPPPGSLADAARAIEAPAPGAPAGQGRREIRVRVRVVRNGEGTVSTLDVQGETRPPAEIPDAIRGAVPQLAAASIAVGPLAAPIEPGVEEAVARARATGERVTVDEKVDASGTRREVRVVVEKKEGAGAE